MFDRIKTTFLMRTLSLVLLAGIAAATTAGCVEEDDGGGPGGSVCGDGVCSFGETASCSDCATEPDADPGPEPICGDGICQESEGPSCSDCMPSTCGNGLCEAGESASCADCAPATASLRVQNHTSSSIWYLYIAPCGASGWGPDRLGANTIPARSSFTFTGIPGGCYGFRAETSAGASGIYWVTPSGVTLSPGQTYTWTLVN